MSATTDDAMGLGLVALLVGLGAIVLFLIVAIALACGVQPDIAQLQEVLCERVSESAADYRDCLDEVR